MRVIQLNLNHCKAAQDLLMQTVREVKPDLAILSEPYKHLETQPWEFDASGKAVIWSCGKLPFQDIASRLDTGYVRVKVKGVHFYSCYAPPSLTIDEFKKVLDNLVADAKQRFPVAIAGDFNAWAVEWGSKGTNGKGQALLEAMSLLDVVLLNAGTKPTFVKAEASSIVDLTFVSSSLARGNQCHWVVSDIYTHSDHQAILWDIRGDFSGTAKTPKTYEKGWKAKMFDAGLFREAFDTSPLTAESTTERVEEIMQRVTDACDTTMPRKRNGDLRTAVHWWNEQIAELRRECHRTRRLAQRARGKRSFPDLEEQHRKARMTLKKAIKQSKADSWGELLSEVEHDPWGRPYKVVMTRLKSQPMPSPKDAALLEKIVTHLFPEQPEEDYQLEEDVDEDIPPITEEELLTAAAKVGNNKAPGRDGIPNIALKAAIKLAPAIFLGMYNACLKEGIFPDKWKWQKLVLLPKGKKPPDEPASYRPLCMLDTAGKIFERIIHNRIEKVVDPLLAESQFGFRKERSTLDAINTVVKQAQQATAGKRWTRGSKKYCAVVALDVKNAFNSAIWKHIMDALKAFGVPLYQQKIVASYLHNRWLMYDTEDGQKTYRVTGGVPQGSVLGPLLWIIMYNALLLLKLPKGVSIVAFADDAALIIIAKFLEQLVALFGEAFAKIKEWMSTVGLQLADHKTEVLLISSRKVMETVTFRVGSAEITSLPSIRYLGVILDARLNFKAQTEQISRKASVVASTLARLMPNVGGPRQKRRKLLSSVTTSVLTYGIPIWAHALKIREYRRKAAAAYRISALRIACAFRTVSEDAINVIAGLLPIEVLAEERRSMYQQQRAKDPSYARIDARTTSLNQWQMMWDASTKGRWTHRLIPKVETWVNRSHGELNYYLTQLISGHGCFRAYLHKFNYDDSPDCPACAAVQETAEHAFFQCPRFSASRVIVEDQLGTSITPGNLIELMLKSADAWAAVAEYAAAVMKELRRAERARNKTSPEDQASTEETSDTNP